MYGTPIASAEPAFEHNVQKALSSLGIRPAYVSINKAEAPATAVRAAADLAAPWKD